MIEFAGHVLLLDVEGTTSPIAFVTEVMFPFARREAPGYLAEHWGEPALMEACAQLARDAGYETLDAWWGSAAPEQQQQQAVLAEVQRLMDSDAKTTGLKALQGLVWQAGFQSGELRAELFDDVPPALLRWNASGRDVRIYSSGSIQAQRLFFGHTEYGNLLPQLQGHYDTTSGPKREAASYRRIAADCGLPSEEILFLSDVPAELTAAREAGMHTALCRRPGNADVASDHGHAELTSFEQVKLID